MTGNGKYQLWKALKIMKSFNKNVKDAKDVAAIPVTTHI